MTAPVMQSINSQLGRGGARVSSDLKGLFQELQGFTVSVIATGAAAGTKMNVANLRLQDVVCSVLATVKATGVAHEDLPNITVQDTHASGTLTFSSAIALDSFNVNGVTYTVQTVPLVATDVLLGASDDATAINAAAVVNAYESRYLPPNPPASNPFASGFNVPRVHCARTSSGVVTVTALDDGAGNAPVITEGVGATMTIVSTVTNAVTVTGASVVNGNTLVVNGVTFTVETTAAASDTPNKQVQLGLTDTATMANMAGAINAYETQIGGLDVHATSVGAVMTVSARRAPRGNNIILTGTTDIAASGSGYLAGGTATGGFKSSTDLSASSVVVYWFDKNGAGAVG